MERIIGCTEVMGIAGQDQSDGSPKVAMYRTRLLDAQKY